MKQRIAVLLMFGMLPWAELHAQSQTVSTTFRVSARVEAVCAVTASDLDFGAYSSGGALLQGTSVLQSTCTPGTTYNIALNGGTGGGTIYGGRQMASGANKLNYQLYRNSARSDIWGNTIGTDTVQDVGTGLAKSHTVYGTVPGAQSVPAGNYADTITVTVSY
jgi:spore coat protein U-like protein